MVRDDDPNWVHDMLGMGSFTTNQISSCNHRLVHLTSFNIFNHQKRGRSHQQRDGFDQQRLATEHGDERPTRNTRVPSGYLLHSHVKCPIYRWFTYKKLSFSMAMLLISRGYLIGFWSIGSEGFDKHPGWWLSPPFFTTLRQQRFLGWSVTIILTTY